MQTKVLILFYSLGGMTEQLARSVAEGALGVRGVETRIRRVADFGRPAAVDRIEPLRLSWERMIEQYEAPTHADLEWADAIVLGSPGRFGVMASELKAFLDTLGPLWMQGKLVNKVGAVFTSASSLHGGVEMTLQNLLVPMMHLGMVLVTPGYADAIMHKAGSPYGAVAVGYGPRFLPPTDDDLDAARFLGKRVAEVAGSLNTGRHAVLNSLAD